MVSGLIERRPLNEGIRSSLKHSLWPQGAVFFGGSQEIVYIVRIQPRSVLFYLVNVIIEKEIGIFLINTSNNFI